MENGDRRYSLDGQRAAVFHSAVRSTMEPGVSNPVNALSVHRAQIRYDSLSQCRGGRNLQEFSDLVPPKSS